MEQSKTQDTLGVSPPKVKNSEWLTERLAKLDSNLTSEELAAPSALDWSNETLGQSVRDMAELIGDLSGERALRGSSAVNILVGLLEEHNAGTLEIEIQLDRPSVRKFKVSVREVMPEPDDPRQTLALLDEGKSDIDLYYEKLDTALAAVKEKIGVGGYFEAADGTIFKLAEPEGHFVKYRKLSYVRTKREGERAGSLSRKEADEWLASRANIKEP